MYKEFTTKDMSDLLEERLNVIKDNGKNTTEITLNNPTTGSKFPCRLIHTPLDSVLKTENAVPILKNFQITIEHWASKQRNCMEMASNTDKVLQGMNMLRTNTQPIIYDEITKKNRLITIYEVRWNALTNSFQVKN